MRVWEGFVFFIYLCFYVLAQQLTQFSPYILLSSGLYSGCCPWLFLCRTQSATSAVGHPTLSHVFIMIFMGRFVKLMSNSLCLSQYTLITSTVLKSVLLLTLPTPVLGASLIIDTGERWQETRGPWMLWFLLSVFTPYVMATCFSANFLQVIFLSILAAVSAVYRPRPCAVFSVLL